MLVPFASQAQIAETVSGGSPIHTAEPSGSETITPLGRINPKNVAKGGQWNPRIDVVQGPPVPGQLSGEKALIQQKSQLKMQALRGGEAPEPGKDDDAGALNPSAKSAGASSPIVNESFQINSNTLSPPDNAIGISQAGKIVSSFNTRVVFHETDGTETFNSSLADFFAPVVPNALVYDPRVIYMHNYDRFAIVVCNGTTTSTSRMFVAFSSTNDPMDPWWFYSFNGTTCTGGDGWFDFPSIGASADLYVSGNLFGNGGGFQQCIIRQISLANAFTGGSVSHTWWCNVDQDNGNLAFTIKPLSYAYGLTYGPGIVLASTWPGSNLYYYYITQNQGNSPVLNTYASNVGSYSGAGGGPQSGSSNLMDTGGTRIRDGFYANGTLHTVWSIDRSGGEAGIRYVRTDFSSGTSEVSSTFGAAGFDYAYPVIQPWGTNIGSWDGSVVVAFLRTGASIFPQFRAVYCDPNQNFGGSFAVKNGESPIINGTTSRWGDYIEACVRVNGTQPEVWIAGQYGSGNAYGNWVAQLLEDIPGCTNPSACNYDPQATLDDGSCETASCTGCQDPTACNFNPNATIAGLCLYPGCTQSNACNYSWLAGCDDGSCCFDNCVSINMIDEFGDGWNGGAYTLTDSNGDVVATGTLADGATETQPLGCIEDGCYNFTVTGGSFPAEITWELVYTFGNFLFGGTPPELFASGGAPYDENLTVGTGGDEAGCTDPLACNYNPDVLCDDGSCCYDNCLEIVMTDSFGDGWNGNVWEVVDPATDTVVDSGTLENGDTGIDFACLTAGCYLFRINVEGGIFSAEVGWTVNGADGGSFSGGSNDEVNFIIGGGAPNAGCTDPIACNYDLNADCDDGSCCYGNCGELMLFDSFGDGWNGATFSVFDENNILVATNTLTGGSMATQTVCLDEGCYTITVSGGTFPGEVSWFLSAGGSYLGGGAPYSGSFTIGGEAGCTDAGACNYDAAAICDDESCVYPGCIDPTACNYDINAVCDDGNCNFDCYGCTYNDAENYDATATQDDGSCIFDCTGVSGCQADIDGNGVVNVSDLLLFLGAFGTEC